MLLKKPDIALAEISERLGFYNPAHFSRFVKKMLGMSPSEYRMNLEKKWRDNENKSDFLRCGWNTNQFQDT